MRSLKYYPKLELVGVMDIDKERSQKFSDYYSVNDYQSIDSLLDDKKIDIVLNLTNPRSHYNITKLCLEAGKHVYSEKPLAMEYDQAEELVQLAKKNNLYLSSAPCNVLSESAQTVLKVLQDKIIGEVRLIYAELDDGLIHRMRYKKWENEIGITWPYKDEFEVGCTLEHAGYYLTWLAAFFGPAKRITAYSKCLIENKINDEYLDYKSPDFSVACIEYENNITARMTNSIVAPHNHGLTIMGDDGVISVDECWNYESPVYVWKRTPLSLRLEKFSILSKVLGLGKKKYPLINNLRLKYRENGMYYMDFARGIAELSSSILKEREPILSAELSLHINEIALAIQYPYTENNCYYLKSSFQHIKPLEWNFSDFK